MLWIRTLVDPAGLCTQTLALCLLLSVELAAEVDDHLMDVVSASKNETLDEGESLEEEWVREAILDLAYYIRSHKFNEYDRRYKTNLSGEPELYGKFPDPPLRKIHWEVARFCSNSLMDCLRYSMEFTGQARIGRAVDTVYITRARNWTLARDRRRVEAADKECRDLYRQDWERAEPFPGPLSRFQWRTSISYFMCAFTMKKLAPLSAFGEPCDNFANCLWDKDTLSTEDPRGNDVFPFACARYSFCPDPCCPTRRVTDMGECDRLKENPCPEEKGLFHSFKTCLLNATKNTNVYGLALNHWNVTCFCKEEGFIWDSRFGMCVDIDECEMHTDKCSKSSQTCLNTRGSYECVCSFGYRWVKENRTCQPIKKLVEFMEKVDYVITGNHTLNLTAFGLDQMTSHSSDHVPSFAFILCVASLIILHNHKEK